MDNPVTDLAYDEWIRAVFDHPVTNPAWYWAEGNPWDPMAQPEVTASYLTQLFENPAASLAAYSDAQINQGLWYLDSPACSNHMFVLKDKHVPLQARIDGIQSIYSLFKDLFLPRCSANLGYLNEKDRGTPNPLDGICYMWWDIMPIPIHGAGGPDQRAMDNAMLDTLSGILDLKSDACRESVLHGLGHHHYSDPKRIEHIIDQFLTANRRLRPELLVYARNAREGRVL